MKENMSLCAHDQLSKGVQIRHADEVIAVDDFIRLFNIKTPSREQIIGNLLGQSAESGDRQRADD
ncbi:hypothetical protein HND97_15370 [Vibrio cholerae]|nr:hypothetical protein HND97_15370 [Vibrio cholerae]